MRRKSDIKQARKHIVNDRCCHDIGNPVYVSRWQWRHASGCYHASNVCPQIFGKGHSGFYTVDRPCALGRNLTPCKRCCNCVR